MWSRKLALAVLSVALCVALFHGGGRAGATSGATVPAARPAQGKRLIGLARAGERVVAVGERGRILLSDDDGRSWWGAPSPTDALLTAAWFSSSQKGWAVGHDAVILSTVDAGVHWRRQFAAPAWNAPLLGLWFDREGRHGIAVGAFGTFVHTEDGGEHWAHASLGEEDRHLYAVARRADGEALMVGERGFIGRIAIDGRGMTTIPSPYAGSLFGLLSVGPRAWLAYGMRGHVLRSDDDGERWREIQTGTEAFLFSGTAGADGRVALAGSGGTLLFSRDGGLSFRAVASPAVGARNAVLAGDAGGLIVLDDRGVERVSWPEAGS